MGLAGKRNVSAKKVKGHLTFYSCDLEAWRVAGLLCFVRVFL